MVELTHAACVDIPIHLKNEDNVMLISKKMFSSAILFLDDNNNIAILSEYLPDT